MFGIVRPCRHSLRPDLERQWWGHLCGLCLSLRDGRGQSARAATNVDAVALSVLVEAQRGEPVETRRAGPCPMRGFRPATVVVPDDPGVGHAVAVSLTMASTKLADHVADGDGWIGRVPWAPTVLAHRWERDGDAAGAIVGLDTAGLRATVVESERRERVPGLTFDEYAEPTEDSAAMACRHAATLAGRPGNGEALDRLGRAFGRIVYLVDAVRDLADDEERGIFNPLLKSVADRGGRLGAAGELLDDAHRRLAAAFDELDLCRPDLARVLFVDQTRKTADRAMRAAGGASARSCGRHRGADAPEQPSASTSLALVVGLGALALGSSKDPWGSLDGPSTAPVSEPQPTKRRWLCDRFTNCCDCCDCCDCCGCDC